MWKGAAVTGTVKGGRQAGGAHHHAANRQGQSFRPRRTARVGTRSAGCRRGSTPSSPTTSARPGSRKSTWAGRVKPGKVENVKMRTKKAGNLTLYLFTPLGDEDEHPTVTPNKQTGQWWSATAVQRDVRLPRALPRQVRRRVQRRRRVVRQDRDRREGEREAARMDFGSFHLTKRGGVGRPGPSVDEVDRPAYPIKNAQVLLFDKVGTKLDETTASATGSFTLDGQLRTQSGMTVVVNPGPSSGWLDPGSRVVPLAESSSPSRPSASPRTIEPSSERCGCPGRPSRPTPASSAPS